LFRRDSFFKGLMEEGRVRRLKRIFGPETAEVVETARMLHREEFHNL
jgi:hypothetical protein